MKLGTVVYNNKIYNLDYMTQNELKELFTAIEEDKDTGFRAAKKIINNED